MKDRFTKRHATSGGLRCPWRQINILKEDVQFLVSFDTNTLPTV